ncbi:hypothetical protein VSR82_00065 [Burkholderia sp. JPY481]
MTTPEFVLIGGSNSGKTHFAGQIYGRLRRAKGNLSLRKDGGTPPNLSPLEDVLESLSSGRAARHTPASTWAEIALPVVAQEGGTFDLKWPDYGGEQIASAFNQRAISDDWRTRLRSAAGWIVLIRLTSETTYSDALERMHKPAEQGKWNDRVIRWDANAYWVEMLQLLLHVAGHGTVNQLHLPKLAVLLSCYDELDTDTRVPQQMLAERLPLVSEFIKAVWLPSAASVWGLSALGRPLSTDSHNEEFIDNGPETQGWIVDPCGNHSTDLTAPLAWLLNAMHDS